MKKGRKKKIRFVQSMPEIAQFSPRGKPGRPDEVELRVDQFEAIRLADLQNYDQSEGAEIMGISRPSFGRILREGRKILADALVHGKIIRIRIGDVQVGVNSRRPLQKPELDHASQSEKILRQNILQFSPKNQSQTDLADPKKTQNKP